jgi:hypothetical protein
MTLAVQPKAVDLAEWIAHQGMFCIDEVLSSTRQYSEHYIRPSSCHQLRLSLCLFRHSLILIELNCDGILSRY